MRRGCGCRSPIGAEQLEKALYRLIDANQAANATLRVCMVRNRGGMCEGPAKLTGANSM